MISPNPILPVVPAKKIELELHIISFPWINTGTGTLVVDEPVRCMVLCRDPKIVLSAKKGFFTKKAAWKFEDDIKVNEMTGEASPVLVRTGGADRHGNPLVAVGFKFNIEALEVGRTTMKVKIGDSEESEFTFDAYETRPVQPTPVVVAPAVIDEAKVVEIVDRRRREIARLEEEERAAPAPVRIRVVTRPDTDDAGGTYDPQPEVDAADHKARRFPIWAAVISALAIVGMVIGLGIGLSHGCGTPTPTTPTTQVGNTSEPSHNP